MESEIGTAVGSSNGIIGGNDDGKFEVESLGLSLGLEGGTEIVSSDGMLDGNEDDKIEGSSLGGSHGA